MKSDGAARENYGGNPVKVRRFGSWVAGFSKSLGGPLLTDLFRQQSYDDLLHIFGPNRAAKVAWSQALYNCGLEKKLWEDAEDFLAYVEAACGGPANAAKRVLLNGMINRQQFHRDALTAHAETPSAYSECISNPLSTVLHAFGTTTYEGPGS